MPVPATPLVGRDAERAVLGRALADLRRGEGGAVVVLGEPGIGKTRLLGEVRRLARIDEVVLMGSASEFGGALPYGAFVAALDDYLRTVDPRLLGGLDDQQHATLAGLMPSYPAAPPAPAPVAVDGQYEVHRSVRGLLRCLASAKPHVIVLDDLHWADTATIATVASLLRRPPGGPVLLLLGARLRQAPATLLAAVGEAVGAGAARRVDLAPLSPSDSRRLLDPRLSDGDAARLVTVAGGNPFYLEQLARMSPTGHAVPGDAGDDTRQGDLPPLVAAALTDELEALDLTARQFLQGAAVAGDPFDADLARTTAGLADEGAVRAIDVLLHGDVIRHTDVPRRFQFRHPLLRRAVYETTPGGWQLAAHERCAQELEQRGASPVLRAGHLEHAGRPGDEQAIATLTRAGELVQARAPLGAARFFAAALRLTPAGLVDRRVALGVALSTAYAVGGRFAEAHRACRDALEVLGPDGSETRLELESLAARLDQVLGHHTEAHARLTHVLARLPPDPTPRRVDLLTQLGVDGFYALDLTAMTTWAARARAAAGTLGDPLHEMRTTALAGLADALDGRIDDALAAVEQAAKVMDSRPDDAFVEDPNVLSTLATAEFQLDRYPEAQAHVERALTVARAAGRGRYVPLLYWSGTIRAARGELPEALDALEQAVEISRIIDYDVGTAWNLAALSTVLAARGDRGRALDAAEEAAELLRTRTARLPAELARLAHVTVLLDAGRPERALEELSAGAGGLGPGGLPARWRPYGFELECRCRLAIGLPQQAERAAADALAVGQALGLGTAVGAARRALAAVALANGDPAAAATETSSAIDAFTRAGAVLEAGRSRVLLGRALAASGRAGQAAGELTRAAEQFEACSADGLRAEADHELRRLGRRRPRRGSFPANGADPLAPLTVREREVAVLVADGRTNPQIAADLFLSGKTVETHLRNVFHKLRLTSRLELARLVDRSENRDR